MPTPKLSATALAVLIAVSSGRRADSVRGYRNAILRGLFAKGLIGNDGVTESGWAIVHASTEE